MSSILQQYSLVGHTALVTGAGGHLGGYMCRALAEAGAHVLANSRTAGKIGELVTCWQREGLSIEAAVFDVTDESATRSFLEACQEEPLSVIVNNAYTGPSGNIQSTDPTHYVQAMDVTVGAAHRLVVSGLPRLRAAVNKFGQASVINVASMYGLVAPDPRLYESPRVANSPCYGAAKAALIQWTRYAACEFGREGIRVNSISPGPFPSSVVQKENPDFVSRLALKVPLGRIGTPSELMGPVLFLASPASSFVSGSNLVVDGGWTAW